MHVIYKKSFKKSLKKQPLSIQTKCLERITLLIKDPDNPILHLHHLKGDMAGISSFNVTGDIRVHLIITKTQYILLDIGTHSELY